MNRTQDIVTKLKELRLEASSFELLLKPIHSSEDSWNLGKLKENELPLYVCLFLDELFAKFLNFSSGPRNWLRESGC